MAPQGLEETVSSGGRNQYALTKRQQSFRSEQNVELRLTQDFILILAKSGKNHIHCL